MFEERNFKEDGFETGFEFLVVLGAKGGGFFGGIDVGVDFVHHEISFAFDFDPVRVFGEFRNVHFSFDAEADSGPFEDPSGTGFLADLVVGFSHHGNEQIDQENGSNDDVDEKEEEGEIVEAVGNEEIVVEAVEHSLEECFAAESKGNPPVFLKENEKAMRKTEEENRKHQSEANHIARKHLHDHDNEHTRG